MGKIFDRFEQSYKYVIDISKYTIRYQVNLMISINR